MVILFISTRTVTITKEVHISDIKRVIEFYQRQISGLTFAIGVKPGETYGSL